MPIEEALVCTYQGLSCMYDISSGTSIYSFKGQAASKATDHSKPISTCVASQDGQGGVFLSSAGGKSAISVWNYQKEVPSHKIIPPAFLTQLCLSHRAQYLLAGTQEGRVIVWEVSSGLLLASIEAHFRPITVLAWTDDDAAFITGSEDGNAALWSLASVFRNQGPSRSPSPYCLLSDHTLSITTLAVGLGTFPRLRILTGSLEGTCKVWDVSNTSQPLLTTFVLGDSEVRHVELETGERFFFAATLQTIYRVDLYRRSNPDYRASSSGVFEPVISGMHSATERMVSDESENLKYDSPEPITSMQLSPLSPILIVGTSDSKISILNLPSMQVVRLIHPPVSSPGPVTYLSTILKPPDLATSSKVSGNQERDSIGSGGQRVWPVRPVGNLQNVLTSGEALVTARGMQMKIPMQDESSIPNFQPVTYPRTIPDSSTRSLESTEISDTTSTTSGAAKLSKENADLKEKLTRAVELNDEMWKGIVEGSVNWTGTHSSSVKASR